MRVRSILPFLLVVMLLAGACMPPWSIPVSSTGTAPTVVVREETAAPAPTVEATPAPPEAPGLATIEAAVTASALATPETPSAGTAAPAPGAESTAVVTGTLPAPVQVTPALTATAPLTETAQIPAVATPITPALPVTPTTEAAAPQAPAMSLFQDEVGGYELDYPENWYLLDVDPAVKRDATGYSVTITSWQPQEPGGQGIPEGGSKVDISVTRGANSIEEAIEARRAEIAQAGGGEIVYEEPWELASGLNAVHWVIQPAQGPIVHEVVTAISGRRIVLSGLGDADLFELLALTLRPISVGLAQGGSPKVQGGAPDPAVRSAPEPTAADRAAAALVAQAAAGGQVYTIRSGDTLARIAARFGVTVSAILAANPAITNPDRIYIGQRITIPTGTQPPPPPPANTTRVNIYMIGLGDGNTGCGDSVVAVRRDIPKTAAPLTAALNLLLSQKNQYYGESGLYNALYQSNLKIQSITRAGGAWTIRLTGTLVTGGTCDSPRVQAQLEQTAKQFSTVQSVRYFINGQTLEQALSTK